MVDFSDAAARLGWSFKHLDRLEREAKTYVDSRPIEFTLEFDKRKFEYKCYATLHTDPPIELSLVALDAIHNARAALDYLACDVAREEGYSTRGIGFPFAADSQNYDDDKRIKERRRKLGTKFGELVDGLRPYRDGNLKLWALNEIDKEAKHLKIVRASLPPKSIRFNSVPGKYIDITPRIFVVDEFRLGVKTPLFSMHVKDLQQVSPSYEIGVSLATGISGIDKDLISGVMALLTEAKEVLDRFKRVAKA